MSAPALVRAPAHAFALQQALEEAGVGVVFVDERGVPVGSWGAVPETLRGEMEALARATLADGALREARCLGPDGAPWRLTTMPVLTEGAQRGAVARAVRASEPLDLVPPPADARRDRLALLGTLVSGVAHEVRTPLAYIANHLWLTRRRLDRAVHGAPVAGADAETLRGHVTSAIEGVDRINALVLQIRQLGPGGAPRKQRATLDRCVAQAVELFRSTQKGGVRVEADLVPTAPVLVDPVQVHQLVLNLLQNGMEAAGADGTVRVATGEADGAAFLRVEDDGPGMDAATLARAFEPFFTTKPTGTGVGLAIVRRVVQDHGGSVTCATAPGRGAAFTVRWPTARSSPPDGDSAEGT